MHLGDTTKFDLLGTLPGALQIFLKVTLLKLNERNVIAHHPLRTLRGQSIPCNVKGLLPYMTCAAEAKMP